jgi:pilus assembly protein Flp/PilA
MSRALAPLFSVLGFFQDRFNTVRKDRGATAVEYGLLVGLIAVVIIAAVTVLGTRLKALFNSIVTSLGGTAAV